MRTSTWVQAWELKAACVLDSFGAECLRHCQEMSECCLAWFVTEDQRHQICKLCFQSKKNLSSIFFRYQGCVAHCVGGDTTSTTTGTYIHTPRQFYPKLSRWCQNNHLLAIGNQNGLYHHDKDSPQISKAVIQYLDEQQKLQILSHIFNSPRHSGPILSQTAFRRFLAMP